MDILNEMRFYEKHGKIPMNCIREAVWQQALFEDSLDEEADTADPETAQVLRDIEAGNYIRNDYESFSKELQRNKRSQFLTPYTPQDLQDGNVQTFQVPGHEIGFGLKPLRNGNVDIVAVHNNTNLRGIGKPLIQSAIKLGGTTLDHYDGFLSGFYSKLGFKETERWPWDDDYAPKDWDKERYGTPDVVLRKLER